MSYIFTHGQCKKNQLYDLIISSLIGAGWQNISSNIPIDGDVLKSTGMTGDKSLYIQLFPYDCFSYPQTAASYNNATYNVRVSSSINDMSIRLPMSYTPGLSGAAGTIKIPGQAVQLFNICNTAAGGVDPNTTVDYDLYVDKNKIIFSVKTPDILSPACSLLYLGMPDTLYVKAQDSRCVMCCAVPAYNVPANTPMMSDYPDVSQGSYGAAYPLQIQQIVPSFAPNVNGNFLLSEPYLNTADCGHIGKMDGVYPLPNTTRATHGDIITVGTSKFKVLNITNQTTSWTGQFNTTYCCIQVS